MLLNTGFRSAVLSLLGSFIKNRSFLPNTGHQRLTNLPRTPKRSPGKNPHYHDHATRGKSQPVRNITRPSANRALYPHQRQHREHTAHNFMKYLSKRAPEPRKTALRRRLRTANYNSTHALILPYWQLAPSPRFYHLPVLMGL